MQSPRQSSLQKNIHTVDLNSPNEATTLYLKKPEVSTVMVGSDYGLFPNVCSNTHTTIIFSLPEKYICMCMCMSQ